MKTKYQLRLSIMVCYVHSMLSINHAFLKQSPWLSCSHDVGLTYAGAFGYADDIALVVPSLYCLKKMISICETFANKYSISFNPSKSKLLCFNVDSSNVAPVFINGKRVEVVQSDVHLGN